MRRSTRRDYSLNAVDERGRTPRTEVADRLACIHSFVCCICDLLLCSYAHNLGSHWLDRVCFMAVHKPIMMTGTIPTIALSQYREVITGKTKVT